MTATFANDATRCWSSSWIIPSVRLESKVSATARRSLGPLVTTVPGGTVGNGANVVVVVGALVVVDPERSARVVGRRWADPDPGRRPAATPTPTNATSEATAVRVMRCRRRRPAAADRDVIACDVSTRTARTPRRSQPRWLPPTSIQARTAPRRRAIGGEPQVKNEPPVGSAGREVQRGEQAPDPLADLVANGTDGLDAQPVGVIELPVLVAFPGDDRTGISAAHGDAG